MNFIPLVPLWLIIAGVALTVIAATSAVVFVFNRPRSRTPSLISFALRLAALIALASFALRPHSEREITKVGDKPVAVLLDVSDSMLLDDGMGKGQSRLERGLKLLDEIRKAVADAGGESVSFAFAGGVIPLTTDTGDDEISKNLARDKTDLARALAGIGDPAAAVVISDGIFDATEDFDFPVFFVNPTDGPAPGGCWVYSAAAPSRALPGSRFPIKINYRSTSDEAVRFEIYEGDKKIASGNGPGRPGADRTTVYVTGNEPGRHFYRIVGLPGESEVFTECEVVRGPITVRYIADIIDYDTGYLRRAMASNEAVELIYYPAALNGDGASVGDLSDTDVIVLANPSAKRLDNRLVAEIENRVADGAGLLLLFSAAKPDFRTIGNDALGPLLPLSGGNPKSVLSGGAPETVTKSSTGGFDSETVPSFSHIWDMGYPKPATEQVWVLNGVPVLSAMRYGRGRVMLLSGGGFYRWENARTEDAPGLAQVAADLLLYLSESADTGIKVSGNLVESGGLLIVSAKAVEEPAFIVTGPGDIPIRLSPLETEPGIWKAEFSPEIAGLYTLTVRRFEKEGLSVDKEHILAVKRTGEKRAGFPGIDAMRTLGSGYFVGNEIPALEKELRSALLETGPETNETRNVPLLPNWIALGLFIVLLLIEWTIRRLMGLA